MIISTHGFETFAETVPFLTRQLVQRASVEDQAALVTELAGKQLMVFTEGSLRLYQEPTNPSIVMTKIFSQVLSCLCLGVAATMKARLSLQAKPCWFTICCTMKPAG